MIFNAVLDVDGIPGCVSALASVLESFFASDFRVIFLKAFSNDEGDSNRCIFMLRPAHNIVFSFFFIYFLFLLFSCFFFSSYVIACRPSAALHSE